MVQTQGGSVSLSVVAQPRQMDSHNPPTGGECGLLEYDTVDVKSFFSLRDSVSSSFLTTHKSSLTVFTSFFFLNGLSRLGATAFKVRQVVCQGGESEFLLLLPVQSPSRETCAVSSRAQHLMRNQAGQNAQWVLLKRQMHS